MVVLLVEGAPVPVDDDDDDDGRMSGKAHAAKTSGENVKNVMHCRFPQMHFVVGCAISKLIMLHDKSLQKHASTLPI